MIGKVFQKRAFSSHTRVAVVGAGCGGQSLIAQLSRTGFVKASDITVFDPSLEHHYQPAYTMVAGGVLGNAKTTKEKFESKVVVKD